MLRPAAPRWTWTVASLLALAAARPRAAAQDSTAQRTLAERLEQLEQQVKVLARLRELERDSSVEVSRTRATVNASPEGFFFRSADGNWRVRVGGYLQADGRYYLADQAAAGTTGLLIRRARPLVEGTVYQYFDFRIMPDFGTGQATIYEAYLEARIRPAFALRAGKFKPPVGLERLQSATDLRFVERGFPTNLVPNRDVGIQVSGDLAGGTLGYATGIFNGVADLGFGDLDANDAKELAGRLFLLPFATQGRRAPVDLGFGISGSIGNERGTVASPLTSTLRTPGQIVVFRYRSSPQATGTAVEDGQRARIEPQGYLYRGSFGLLAQYTVSRHTVRRDTAAGRSIIDRFSHRAWQVAGSVFLTGEKASFRSLTPKHPFDPKSGTWGALEVTARIQGTSVPDEVFPVFADPATSVQSIRAWALGLNWHLAKNVKLIMDYERAVFHGGAVAGNRRAENLLITRFQTAF